MKNKKMSILLVLMIVFMVNQTSGKQMFSTSNGNGNTELYYTGDYRYTLEHESDYHSYHGMVLYFELDFEIINPGISVYCGLRINDSNGNWWEAPEATFDSSSVENGSIITFRPGFPASYILSRRGFNSSAFSISNLITVTIGPVVSWTEEEPTRYFNRDEFERNKTFGVIPADTFVIEITSFVCGSTGDSNSVNMLLLAQYGINLDKYLTTGDTITIRVITVTDSDVQGNITVNGVSRGEILLYPDDQITDPYTMLVLPEEDFEAVNSTSDNYQYHFKDHTLVDDSKSYNISYTDEKGKKTFFYNKITGFLERMIIEDYDDGIIAFDYFEVTVTRQVIGNNSAITSWSPFSLFFAVITLLLFACWTRKRR